MKHVSCLFAPQIVLSPQDKNTFVPVMLIFISNFASRETLNKSSHFPACSFKIDLHWYLEFIFSSTSNNELRCCPCVFHAKKLPFLLRCASCWLHIQNRFLEIDLMWGGDGADFKAKTLLKTTKFISSQGYD